MSQQTFLKQREKFGVVDAGQHKTVAYAGWENYTDHRWYVLAITLQYIFNQSAMMIKLNCHLYFYHSLFQKTAL